MFSIATKHFVVVIFLLSLSQGLAQTTLQYNVQPKQKFGYSMTSLIDQQMTQMGQEMKINMNLATDLNLEITNVTKNITLQMQYINPKIEMKGMEAMGVADTTIDANSQLNFKQEYVFTKNGTMVSHKLIEEKQEELDQQAKMMKQQLTSQLKQSTDFLIYKYPTKSVKVGDTWNTSDTVDVNGLKTVRNFIHTYTSTKKLNGVDVAEITTKSTNISINGTINQMGMEMEVRGGMNVNAVATVDIKSGMVITMDMKNNSDFTMSMTTPMEMTIPITLNIVTSLNKK
ncbi:MAG: hypothetical protein JNL36_02205 [Candidatus Kapabacteria bacterium]|nr:hypothetical protein [Candidatus Kapabacteria bacterium]